MKYRRFSEKFLAVIGSACFINLGTLVTAEAITFLSVDTDPVTPGIQSSLVVDPGDNFTIDILISEDATSTGPTIFDTVILETFFNDAGNVLGLGSIGPIAGSIASSSLTLDVFGGGSLATTGASLFTTAPSATSATPFANASGAIGLTSFPFMIAPGTTTSIFSLDFTALNSGTSSILAAGSPAGSPELAFGGAPIPATLVSGNITVTGPEDPVPEPSSILGTGLALGFGIFVFNRYKRNSKSN